MPVQHLPRGDEGDIRILGSLVLSNDQRDFIDSLALNPNDQIDNLFFARLKQYVSPGFARNSQLGNLLAPENDLGCHGFFSLFGIVVGDPERI